MNVSDDKTASVSSAAYLRESLRRKAKHSSRQLEEVVAGAAIGEGVSPSHLASVVGQAHLPKGGSSVSLQKLCRKAEKKQPPVRAPRGRVNRATSRRCAVCHRSRPSKGGSTGEDRLEGCMVETGALADPIDC
jgi:hypothetical protein